MIETRLLLPDHAVPSRAADADDDADASPDDEKAEENAKKRIARTHIEHLVGLVKRFVADARKETTLSSVTLSRMRSRHLVAGVALLLSGCSGPPGGTSDGGSPIDASAGDADAATVDAPNVDAPMEPIDAAPDAVDDTGDTWTVRWSTTDAWLHRVAWSGSLYVAVGARGMIIRSPDGATWNFAISGTTYDLWGVTASPTQFVAVGDQGTIVTSPDAVNWTVRTSPLAAALHGVVWSGTQFVAVGDLQDQLGNPHTAVLTSPDGITWSARPSGDVAGIIGLNAIAWSGSLFVAVGTGYVPAHATPAVATSPDGITWTSQTVSPNNGYFQDVAWNGTRWMAVGYSANAYTSTDGANWTQVGAGVVTGEAVAWGATRFLTCFSVYCQNSDDGSYWNETMLPGTTTLSSLVWGGTEWVGVGYNGAVVTSP
jgi:hypothetical protein